MKRLLLFFITVLMLVGSAHADLTSGNIRYFSFDNADTSGSTSIDSSGNQNGTINGLTTGVTGILGEAYEADGTDMGVNVSYTGTDEFTVSAWVKGTGTVDIISSDTESGTARNWRLQPNLGANWVGTNVNVVNPTSTVNDGSWHFVTIRYNGSGLAYFVDNVEEDIDTTYTGNNNNANVDIYIFQRRSSSTSSFNGIIDEVGVWNRSLSNAELDELYNSGSGLNPYGSSIPPITNTTLTIDSIYFNGSLIQNNTIFSNNDFPFNMSVQEPEINFSRGFYDEVFILNGDNNTIDMSGYNHTVTNNGATYESGVYGNAYSFDNSSANYLEIPDSTMLDNIDQNTITAWVYLNNYYGSEIDLVDKAGSGGFRLLIQGSSPRLGCLYKGLTDEISSGASIDLNNDQWYFLVCQYNGTHINTWVDMTQDISDDSSGSLSTDSDIMTLGLRRIINDRRLNGKLDDVRIFSRALSESDLQNIYTSSSVYYKTDLSYNLSSTSTTFAENTLTGSGTLTDVPDGSYTIYYNTSNNVSYRSSGTYHFVVDTTQPNLTVQNNTEWDSYDIDFNSIINFSDTNLDYCAVQIFSDNFSCTNTSYNSALNGNISFNVTVRDSAGNIAQSLNNNVYVNPLQYFYFENSSGTQLSNFTFGGTTYSSSPVSINVYEFPVFGGDNTFTFTKSGYLTTNITFNINTSSRINLTTVLDQSQIVLKVYDRETRTLVANNTLITLVASIGAEVNATNGVVNISNLNFVDEQYTVIATHPFYFTEEVYFTYDNLENLNVNIYMLNNNSDDAGTINLQVQDTSGLLQENVICSALEWIPAESAYSAVAQGLTNINGLTTLNIEIGTKLYKFSCTKDGVTAITSQQIIQTSGGTLTIVLAESGLTPSAVLEGISYNFTNTTYNSTYNRLNFSYSDSKNLVTSACIRAYRQSGSKLELLQSSCTSSSTGQVQMVTLTNNTFDKLVRAEVVKGSQTYVIDSYRFVGSQSFSNIFSDYSLLMFIPILLILAGIFVVTKLDVIIGSLVILVGMVVSYILIPSIITFVVLGLIILVLITIVITGGTRRK